MAICKRARTEKVLGLSQKFERDLSCCCAAAARYLNFVCFPRRLACRLINCDKRVVRRLCEQLQQQQISIYFKFLCIHTRAYD